MLILKVFVMIMALSLLSVASGTELKNFEDPKRPFDSAMGAWLGKNYKKTIFYCDKALAENEKQPAVYLLKAWAYAALKMDKSAIEQYEKYFALKADNFEVFLERAAIYVRLDRIDLACQDFKRGMQSVKTSAVESAQAHWDFYCDR